MSAEGTAAAGATVATATPVATATRWGEVDAARLTPPAVSDPRGRAMVETVAALLRETPLTAFLLTDPWTVDARALPALLAAAGVSDLIEPGLPQAHARAILAAAREINAERGRVVAIRRALASVGLTATITLWYQTTPKGPPNTYDITVWAEDQVIPERVGDTSAGGTGAGGPGDDGPDDGPGDDHPLINAATQRQAFRLVDATKRWSQQGSVRIGVAAPLPLALVGAATGAALITIDCIVPPQIEMDGALALVAAGTLAAVVTVDCAAVAAAA